METFSVANLNFILLISILALSQVRRSNWLLYSTCYSCRLYIQRLTLGFSGSDKSKLPLSTLQESWVIQKCVRLGSSGIFRHKPGQSQAEPQVFSAFRLRRGGELRSSSRQLSKVYSVSWERSATENRRMSTRIFLRSIHSWMWRRT